MRAVVTLALMIGSLCTASHLRGQQSSPGESPEGMVWVEGGKYAPFYSMGPDTVEVKGFFIDRHHVTNREFLQFVEENPEWRRGNVLPIFADERYLQHWKGDLDPGTEILDSPVISVSWFAARAYARWKGRRLPTLDEWEFVAAASEFEKLASRDSMFVRQILSWYSSRQPDQLPPVGSGRPNYYGIFNLHGVIWEWVEDFNTVFITGESRDGGGVNRQFYCAGGAAAATDTENYAAFMRFAFRGSLKAHFTVKNLGFRTAMDGPAPS